MSPTKVLSYVAAAGLGAAAAFSAIVPSFIAGTGGRWTHPDNDLIAYLVAWNYFIADKWRWPLFSLPHMGYPEGGSLLFNDGLPIGALLSKGLFQLFGTRVNPFGWWLLVAFVMQAVMAVRVVRALGAASFAGALGAAALAVGSLPFLSRMGHVALAGHFVILWALALYFESVSARKLRTVELGFLAAFVLLVNPYLFGMVMAVQAATVIAVAADTRPGVRFWIRTLATYAAVAAVGVVAGYGAVLLHPTTMKAAGFGIYSWNPLSLFVPPEAFWGVPAGVVRDATGGQYEGDAYVGAGAVLLLLVYLLAERTRLRAAVRRHRILCGLFVLLALFAASNKVYVGGTLVVSYYLPSFIESLASFFRVSGRFIWPLAYSLILVPVAVIHRRWHPAAAVALTGAAIALQVSETQIVARHVRTYTGVVLTDLVDIPHTGGLMMEHSRVWQYPSWECGGLVRAGRAYGSREVNQELQLQLLASQLGRPSNSVLMSRAQKNCAAERLWAQEARLDPDVLYVLGRESPQDSPRLAELTASAACVKMEWGFTCSRRWLPPVAPAPKVALPLRP